MLQRHLGWTLGAPAYALATYVAAQRVQDKRHFLSDMTFGAAAGIVAGRSVTIGRGSTRFVVAPALAPGGAAVSFTLLPKNQWYVLVILRAGRPLVARTTAVESCRGTPRSGDLVHASELHMAAHPDPDYLTSHFQRSSFQLPYVKTGRVCGDPPQACLPCDRAS